MNLDLHTLALVLCLASLLQGVALLAQYRASRAQAGLGWWTLGSGAYALGFAANALRGIGWLGHFAIAANVMLFLAGSALNLVGVRRFFRRPAPFRGLLRMLAAALVVLLAFTFLRDELAVRRVLLSALLAALSGLTVATLRANRSGPVAASVDFLTVVFGLHGAFMLWRALTPFLGGPVGGIFTASPLQVASYLVQLAAGMLWNFGFIILVNQRLNAESREAKEHFQAIFATSPDAVLLSRLADGAVVDLNDQFTELTGYDREDVLGRSSLEIGLWADPGDRARFAALRDHRGAFRDVEFSFLHRDGRVLTGLVSGAIVTLLGQPHLLSVARDITARKRAEAALQENNAFLSEMIENNGALIYVKDVEGRYELVNRRWEEVTGLRREQVIGRKDVDLFEGEAGRTFRRLDLEVLSSGQMCEEEETLLGPAGEHHFLSIKFPLRRQDGSVRGLCGLSTEITQRKLDEQRIQELAHQLEIERDYARNSAQTDGLTRLANRRHFDEVINAEFFRLRRSGGMLSLILLDIDYFKMFNDTYGHLAGDDCLRVVAGALQRVVGRSSDLLARYGGEEFAVILPETGQAGAEAMAERIRLAVEELAIAHTGQPGRTCVTVSLGGATRPISALGSPDKLILLADESLYRAKTAGRNRVEWAAADTGDGPREPGLVRLVWRPGAESGNAVIDNQHQALFRAANDLLAAVLDERPEAACRPLLAKLLRDVTDHFRDEEAILGSVSYPFRDEHGARHRELLEKAGALAAAYDRRELSLGELFGFLAYDVVAQHMFKEDRQFFPYL